jgi:hypothetical protein
MASQLFEAERPNRQFLPRTNRDEAAEQQHAADALRAMQLNEDRIVVWP